MITLYLITDYKDNFVGLFRRKEDAEEIYSYHGDSITEINFEDDDSYGD